MIRGILILLLLTACTPIASAPVPVASPQDMRQQLLSLPGAVVSETDPLQISYPQQSLFADGAVLPLPGGPQLLDPLAAALANRPQQRWQVQVRARTGQGADYDLALAERRSGLLKIYLEGRGLNLANFSFVASTAPGPPLELLLQPNPPQ